MLEQGNGGVMDEGCTSVHLAMGLHMEAPPTDT